MSSNYSATIIGKTIGQLNDEIVSTFKEIIWKYKGNVIDSKLLCEKRVIDILFEIEPESTEHLRHEAENLSDSFNVDIIIQLSGTSRQDKQLFVFDMDSTLIQQEVIDLIAAHANVEKQVSEITERAMNGLIDFSQSFKERVNLLAGLPTTVFEQIKPSITFTPGAKELTQFLRKKGCQLAVLSGGFLPLAEWVKSTLKLDYAFANTLELSENGSKFTGKPLGKIVDGARKAQLLQEIAQENSIDLSKVVAVGDGSNDLPMMGVAGFGIAWNAKPIVQKKAPSKLNTESLQDVLYIMGYTEEEQKKVLSSS